MRLHICHPSIQESTYLPFFHKWQAMSSLPLWISTGNDKLPMPSACSVGWWLMAGAGLF
jgi:hypothetical protein